VLPNVIASRLQLILEEERGGLFIIVAVGLTAVVLVVALVVDVANWKVHSRHLQLQADAAALAAARALGASSCSNSEIAAEAHKYGGPDASGALALYNEQVGGTPASKMHILINSSGYYGDSGAGDNTDPNGSPCTAHYVDIKATETDLPWFVGFGGIVRKINAHARVSLLQESASNGTLPVAVPNPQPTSAAAIFINEGTGAVLASTLLDDAGQGGGGLEIWDNSLRVPYVSVPIQGPNTGVVIALSGKQSLSLASNNLTTICQQALTDCYDATSDPPTKGLAFIRGYSTVGSGTPPNQPILRGVQLFGTTCTPYFSDGTCTYDLVARIDAGTALPEADQIYTANGVQLTASSDPNCAFIPDFGKCWHQTLTVPGNTGANDITITWEETSGCLIPSGCAANQLCRVNGNRSWCRGNFGVAQRAYTARDTTSGPIKAFDLRLCDDLSCPTSGRSYPVGDSHRFVVAIGIGGTLQNAANVNAPLVVLRVKSQANQALDCDDRYTNLKQELELGCRPTYVPNAGSPDCSTLGTAALWASPRPWSCIAVSTGAQPNDVSAGLNARLYQGNQQPNTCAPVDSNGHNNWHMFNLNLPNDGFPNGDPRILNAYITTYGAFSHVNGTSGSVPVIGFGHFYVTGYTGQGGGFDNPCYPGPPSNYPGLYPDDRVPNDDPGLIVGRFIYFVDTVGGDGTAPCDPTSIFACVTVMTK
jgi:hypothetical protein